MAGSDRKLYERGAGLLEPYAREPVEPGTQDLAADLRLSSAQAQSSATCPEPAREHGQVNHERDIRERELAEVDDHVALRAEGPRERLPSTSLCGPVLVSAAAQSRRLFTEVDDQLSYIQRCSRAASRLGVLP